MRLVVVRWRFHPDGRWSATVIAEGRPWVEVDAGSGHEVAVSVGAGLEELAARWGCGIRAVHDLAGDPRAFAVVAMVEGFGSNVPEHVTPR